MGITDKSIEITRYALALEGLPVLIIINELLLLSLVTFGPRNIGGRPQEYYFLYLGLQASLFAFIIIYRIAIHKLYIWSTILKLENVYKRRYILYVIGIYFLFFAAAIMIVVPTLPHKVIIFSHLTWYSLIVTSLLMRVEYLGSKMLSQKEAVAGSLVTLFAIYVLIYIHELGLIW